MQHVYEIEYRQTFKRFLKKTYTDTVCVTGDAVEAGHYLRRAALKEVYKTDGGELRCTNVQVNSVRKICSITK